MKSMDLSYDEIPLTYYVKCVKLEGQEIPIEDYKACEYHNGFLENIDPLRIVCNLLKRRKKKTAV